METNLIPDYDKKSEFMKKFAGEFEQATSYDAVEDSIAEYIKVYQEFEKNNIIELNDRCFFFYLCVRAKPVLFRYTGMVSPEYYIEQFEKNISIMGDKAFDWVMAMVRDLNCADGCMQELSLNMGDHNDSRITNIELIDEYVCRKAMSMGWNGQYPDGYIFDPDDQKTLAVFNKTPTPSNQSQYSSSNYSTQSNSNSQKGGCYVATAVYGSYDCPEVWTLRRYRDYSLSKTFFGRTFIKTYYAISPTLVKLFGESKWFKTLWKPTLDKMVKRLNEQGYENTNYYDCD